MSSNSTRTSLHTCTKTSIIFFLNTCIQIIQEPITVTQTVKTMIRLCTAQSDQSFHCSHWSLFYSGKDLIPGCICTLYFIRNLITTWNHTILITWLYCYFIRLLNSKYLFISPYFITSQINLALTFSDLLGCPPFLQSLFYMYYVSRG